MQREEAEIAAMMVRLRTPLSRIELAASQLLRAASTPGARNLSSGISEAVAEIDDRIAQILQTLVEPAPDSSPAEDCRPAVEELRCRMAPVLRARAIDWPAPSDPDSLEPVLGNRQAVRAGALALVQAGIELIGHGGRFTLSLEPGHDFNGFGLLLRVTTKHVSTPGSDLDSDSPNGADAFIGPRKFARANGGEFETRDGADYIDAMLWFGTGAAPCVA